MNVVVRTVGLILGDELPQGTSWRLLDAHWQLPGVENAVDGGQQVLSAVKFVGHGAAGQAAAGVDVPEGFPGCGVQRLQIAGKVGGDEQAPGGGQDSGSIFSVADHRGAVMVPADLAGLVINRQQLGL